MDAISHGKVGERIASFRWLFEPAGEVNDAGRSFLLGQLLGAPAATIMGSFCAIVVVMVALLRSGHPVYGIFAALECVLIVLRITEWKLRVRKTRVNQAHVPAIDASVLLSTLWCTLQGISAFTIMSDNDPVLRVLSATLVMALIGPICARNYAAPRFAFLLILLCDLPFVAGAIASREPWLGVIALITPPFLLGAMQIIMTFHRAMLRSLAAEARNLSLAQHDSLTGVLNRQGMDAALSQVTPQSERTMALLSIDLDGFKQVNDRYGHGAGDLLLIQVAKRIEAELSSDHLLGRMGGDEFMVVMRNVAPDEVRSSVESLIAAISHCPYELGSGTAVRIGASIGFACTPEDAATTMDLRLRSDEALYAAKGAGKGVGLRYQEHVQNVGMVRDAGQVSSKFSIFERGARDCG